MKPQCDYYQVSLKILLKNAEDKFLLLKAQAGDTYEGFYDLPGGRIDEQEFTVPLPDILRREVREEIGSIAYTLQSRPVAVGRHLIPEDISKNRPDIHILYLLYEGLYKSGDITISAEHTGFGWFDLTKEDPAKYLKSGNLEVVRMYLAKGDA